MASKNKNQNAEAQQAANQRRLNPVVIKYETKTAPRSSDATGEFQRDWARLEKSGLYDMSLLKTVMMHLIANDGPLPAEYLDHPLSGTYKDHRDCHINGDWLLIYKISPKDVIFTRTGTHSELFKK